ncbi:MAG TPA: LemA family protein, partial [Candidatus Gracilibacteria bacterium]|nr:LemA family protein [Candidatus Gracilibacteria bacterium]
YNATVRDFNTKLEVFPNNIVAGMFGFKRRDFFEITEGERENVKVSFSDDDKGSDTSDSKESEDNN